MNMNVEILGLPRAADKHLKATVGTMSPKLELCDREHRVPSRDKPDVEVIFATRTSRVHSCLQLEKKKTKHEAPVFDGH